MSRTKYEVADIISQYGLVFKQKFEPTFQEWKVLESIKSCRTSKLGGHIDSCTSCGRIRISYNSCRDRHCPKCQSTKRERWIEAREEELLNTSYFHVVFTVPEQLNSLFLFRSKTMYNILFDAVNKTLETFALDPKHLGAQGGHLLILHTWGQNLSYHPHIHGIVPAGGITKKGKWKMVKKGKGDQTKYLYPVKALSKVFRGIFLRSVQEEQALSLQVDQSLLRKLYQNEWVVYSKQPFYGPKQVIDYLGRYTHKVAISNHRITSIEDSKVSFLWRDYRQGYKSKEMTLEATEFLRRFCQHILPYRFTKIRHYGILSNRNKSKIREIQFLMGIIVEKKEKKSWQEISKEKLHFDPVACPHCGIGHFVMISSWNGRAPPKPEVRKQGNLTF